MSDVSDDYNKYGKFTKISDLEVGTKFYVRNGHWYGEIKLIDGVRYIYIGEIDTIVGIRDDYELAIDILGGVSK